MAEPTWGSTAYLFGENQAGRVNVGDGNNRLWMQSNLNQR